MKSLVGNTWKDFRILKVNRESRIPHAIHWRGRTVGKARLQEACAWMSGIDETSTFACCSRSFGILWHSAAFPGMPCFLATFQSIVTVPTLAAGVTAAQAVQKSCSISDLSAPQGWAFCQLHVNVHLHICRSIHAWQTNHLLNRVLLLALSDRGSSVEAT